jgi:PWI domain
MKEWIAKRVTELLGIEEEVLIGMIFNILEGGEVNGHVDGANFLSVTVTFASLCLILGFSCVTYTFIVMQSNGKLIYVTLVPFLEKNTGLFMKVCCFSLKQSVSLLQLLPR